MTSQSFSMVAERLGLTESELRELINRHKIPIGGRVKVLTSDKIKMIEEKVIFERKLEQKKKRVDEETELPRKVSSAEQEEEFTPLPEHDQQVPTIKADQPLVLKTVTITAPISPKNLGAALGVSPNEIIKKLFENGMMVTLNQEVDFETAEIIASDFDITLKEEIVDVPDEDKSIEDLIIASSSGKKLKDRPPVVTIMGHVDHGKTTLLDAFRDTNVVASEAGGITQRIGAYQIEKKKKKITFIDTPGHEAFTEMRARGAKVTDIVILVVAADDGVQPQTIEAINHAKAADVPIIVAINKIDKANANPDLVKRGLAEHNLLIEEWGGQIIAVPISAKKREGLDELLDMVLLVAELQEFKAAIDTRAIGTIIESRLDKGKGAVATVLVQSGTLKVGDIVTIGSVFGRVRAMHDYLGNNLKQALPSEPAEIIGLAEVPKAGEILQVFTDEKKAKAIAARRARSARNQALSMKQVVSLENFSQKLREGKLDQLTLILKVDTRGSLEAIKNSFEKIDQSEVRIHIIHEGIGDISNSDVSLSAASGAILIGFNVKVPSLIEKSAKLVGVSINLYNVIYDLLDHIQQAINGIIKAKPKEVAIGTMRVKQRFATFPKRVIVGGIVTKGFVSSKAHAKIFRDGEQVATGILKELRKINEIVERVEKDNECGIQLETGFRKLKEGDILEFYEWEGGFL